MKRAILVLYLTAFAMLPATARPQADCEEYYGNDKPCPADGKYYDHLGKVQPHTCNNNYQTADADKCICAKATTKLEQCPENNMMMDMSKCLVYCRESHDCDCVTVCDFNGK